MKISDTDKKYLLSLKPEDLTFDVLVSLFGNTIHQGESISQGRKSRFETTDTLTLIPPELGVKEKTETTVGRVIYHIYLTIRCGFEDILGFINQPITDGFNGKIEKKLSQALIDEKITMDQFIKYIDYRDNLGMQLNSVITTSFTQKSVKTPPSVVKRQKELFKQYDKELSEGDIVTSEKIEKELMSMAKKELAGDPGLDLYNSEARGNFGNYKNMNLFKGASFDPQTGKHKIVKSSFMSGITKEDVPDFGTAVVNL